MQKFEDLIVRQVSKKLIINIYKDFKENKDFWFKDQIQRASVSIMNNIAEWYERKTLKDKQKFYIIAKGSAWEVRSMLYLAVELWYITKENFESYLRKSYSISSMISKLISNMTF